MHSLQQFLPTWARLGAAVKSSVHGPGTITNANRRAIGVHWDSNGRDRMTDCWYQDEAGDGRYTAGHGIDELTPATSEAVTD